MKTLKMFEHEYQCQKCLKGFSDVFFFDPKYTEIKNGYIVPHSRVGCFLPITEENFHEFFMISQFLEASKRLTGLCGTLGRLVGRIC